jgi:Sec-independent protein secretion pathway component TatC
MDHRSPRFWNRQGRAIAILLVASAVVANLLTPTPDPISLAIAALACCLLCGLGYWLGRWSATADVEATTSLDREEVQP